MQFKKISVVGLGYIGLPTAAMFASRKIEVVGVDVNQTAVDTINRGEIHIVEPDLDAVVREAVADGYLRATIRPEPAQAFLIAVPTPFKGDNHEPDLSYIEAASKAIAPVLENGNIVILESTSPVGATESMAGWLASARPDLSFPQDKGDKSDIRIAHCPERVLPGKVMQELITNDRVIGGMTSRCSQVAAGLYRKFVEGECVEASTPRVAEMAKLTENSFRDVNIAFANELSMICDQQNVNVWELIALANRHPRVNILKPGAGVGGHCIAVDPWFIVSATPSKAKLIRTARDVNDNKPEWVVSQIKLGVAEYLEAHPESAENEVSVACFGLAFKPDIDDFRESPALRVVQLFSQDHPGELLVVEPHIDKNQEAMFPGLKFIDVEEAGRADVFVLLVGHSAFDGELVSSLSAGKVVIDVVGVTLAAKFK